MAAIFRHLIAVCLALALCLGGISTGLAEESFRTPDELVIKSEAVFRSFMTDSEMQWFRQQLPRTRGIFIVPQLLRAGFFVGGSGGSGVLLIHDSNTGAWSQPAFYTMGAVSFGFQIGAEASEVILLLMTDQAVDAMLSNQVKVGGDISIAAGPVGATAKAQLADVFAYGRSKGAYGGLSVEGALIAPRDDWNSHFYRQPVRPVDILVKKSVSNPAADSLVRAMPALATRKPLGY